MNSPGYGANAPTGSPSAWQANPRAALRYVQHGFGSTAVAAVRPSEGFAVKASGREYPRPGVSRSSRTGVQRELIGWNGGARRVNTIRSWGARPKRAGPN